MSISVATSIGDSVMSPAKNYIASIYTQLLTTYGKTQLTQGIAKSKSVSNIYRKREREPLIFIQPKYRTNSKQL